MDKLRKIFFMLIVCVNSNFNDKFGKKDQLLAQILEIYLNYNKYLQQNQRFLQMEQQIYDYGNNIQTSDLCADVGYLLILPFKHTEANNPKNFKFYPYIVTFTDYNTKMKDVMEEYKTMNKEVKNKKLMFTLNKGDQLEEEMSIREFMARMGGININGTNLFTDQAHSPQVDSDQENILSIHDQCAIQNYFKHQSGFGSDFKNLLIQLERPKSMNEVFTVRVHGESNCNVFTNKIIDQIKKQFGVALKLEDIAEIINKDTKMKLQPNKFLIAQKIFDKTKILVRLKNPNIQLKRLKTKDYNSFITIYKEGERDPRRFKYSDISELTFGQLYSTHLELEESKQRKDLYYGLKITDIIIKPHQRINLAEIYFKNYSKEPLNIVAKVINQKMVFFYTIPQLLKQEQEFILDKYIKIPKNQEEHRRNFRQKARQRAQKTKNEYFKRIQRLEPILIYTTELRYFEQKEKKEAKIYESLNRFLRDTPILSLEEDKLRQEWRYLYSSTLLKHLQNIPKYYGKVFRGISYDPKAEKGKIITFKQFLSTSVDRNSALNFAIKGNNPIKHLFELEIFEGFPIKEYSVFMKEEEILLQPFTDFEVVDVKQSNEKVSGIVYTINTYYLKQLKTLKKLPDVRANFLVWIDDKIKEGQKIYSNLEMQETTMLVQILSTAELKLWLNQNHYLFQDKTANLIFITNMSRVQSGKFNEYAGIEGLKQIREFDKKIPVFFYIGDVDKANKKLAQRKADTNNVLVGSNLVQIKQFIKKKMQGKN